MSWNSATRGEFVELGPDQRLAILRMMKDFAAKTIGSPSIALKAAVREFNNTGSLAGLGRIINENESAMGNALNTTPGGHRTRAVRAKIDLALGLPQGSIEALLGYH